MLSIRMFAFLAVTVTVTSTVISSSTEAAERPSSTMPLRSVRLYETGVGYFERTGRLSGSGGVSLPVPAGHLDDALKTLVVLGADGATQVSGIEFASSTTRDRAGSLAGLPTAEGERITYQHLLDTLKGASVELRAGTQVYRGRLVDVLSAEDSAIETCVNPPAVAGAEPTPCEVRRQMTLLMLTDRGEVRRFPASEVTSVRPTDAATVARLGSGLDAVTVRGTQTNRSLEVAASSSGPVTLGYIAETPVWRATYRLVLSSDREQGMLQGWALLHNDTDEDWKKVSVELVNGQPTSFLFPLAAPRYARRELVTPEVEMSTVPQLQDTTVDNLWRGNLWGESIGEAYGAGGLALSGVGEGGGGRGEGLGMIGTIGHGAGVADGSVGASTVLSVGNLAGIAKTDAVESGALFRYVLTAPLNLRAHGSALVPFAQETLDARRIAYLDAPGQAARAALHLTNDTKQTLPVGTIAVYADGGFAGESAIDRLQPTQSRILSYGLDLDLHLDRAGSTSSEEPRLVTFRNNRLVEHFVRRHDVTYEIVNRGGTPRTVYLSLDYVHNAKVTGADEISFDSVRNKAVAVFLVDGKKRVSRKVQVEEGLSRAWAFDGLDSETLRKLARSERLSEASRSTIRLAAEHLAAAENRIQTEAKRRARVEHLEDSLPRLRANLRSVEKSSASSAKVFAEKIVETERRVQQMEQEADALLVDSTRRRKLAGEALSRLTEPPGDRSVLSSN